MSSSISGIGGNSAMMMQGMRGAKRPDPAQMADNLFSKLDSTGQGYLSKADLQGAFDKVASSSSGGSSSASSSVDALFSQLDGDGDGKVTKQEFSDTLTKLAEQFDNQAMSMRMNGGMPSGGHGGGMSGMMGGMPPPPPPAGDDGGGMTKDQLSSAADKAGSTDSTAASALQSLADNFDKADTNGDGTVSMQEALAYQQKAATSDATSASSSTASTQTTAAGSGADVIMQQIAKLMQAYNVGNDMSSSLMSTLSVSA